MSTWPPVTHQDVQDAVTRLRSATLNVLDYGAKGDGTTDDTTAIQNAINANTGSQIVFPPGTYLVTQLQLPSNTWLELGQAVIMRAGTATSGSDAGATLRNTNQSLTSYGDTNIVVRGGTITGQSGASGRPWAMTGVNGLRVEGLTISKGSATFTDFMFYFGNCANVIVNDCRATGGTAAGEDGLHIKCSQNMTVSNCVIDAGDDALVLVHQFGMTNPIKNIAISNCVLSSQSAHLLRISIYSGETQPIQDVTLTNIVGHPPASTPSGNAVIINDDTNSGLLRRVSLNDVLMNVTGYPGNAVEIDYAVDCTFSNWRVYGAANRSFILTGLQRCEFTNVIADTPVNPTGNPQWYMIDAVACTFVGCEARDSNIAGFNIDANTTTSTHDLTFIACKAVNCAQQAWTIAWAQRVALIGCTAIGGASPVSCNATFPPVDVKVIGCHFSGYTGAEVANPVATLIYIGNTDTAGRGTQFPNNKLGFFGTTPVAKPTVTGSKGSNAALASLLTALASQGLITDSST